MNKTEELLKVKTAMTHLMACVKDLAIPKEDRNAYYADYLQLSKNYLIMMRG